MQPHFYNPIIVCVLDHITEPGPQGHITQGGRIWWSNFYPGAGIADENYTKYQMTECVCS